MAGVDSLESMPMLLVYGSEPFSVMLCNSECIQTKCSKLAVKPGQLDIKITLNGGQQPILPLLLPFFTLKSAPRRRVQGWISSFKKPTASLP